MIAFIDIEHLRVKALNPAEWKQHLSLMLDIKYRLEEVSGEPCLIIHYEKLTPALLHELEIRSVLVSGNMTEFQHYEEEKLAGLRAVFREAARPTIGFCGGAQMMAETFGSQAAAIDPTGAGDMLDGNWKERPHEWGYTPVTQLAPHPLLTDLTQEFTVMEAHYWEIKSVPDGFKNYATTDTSKIQLLAHDTLPLYGTQFHPEEWDKDHPDGRKFLENFFNLGSKK